MMKLLRLMLPILILGAAAIFAIENWSPTVPLVIVGTQTIALPLALWLLMACGLGILTIVAIALCLQVLGPSTATAPNSRPTVNPSDDPVNPSDDSRRSGPFRRSSQFNSDTFNSPDRDNRDRQQSPSSFVSPPHRETEGPATAGSEAPQSLEEWEEFSRPRYDWDDWQPRSTPPQSSPSTSNASAKAPWTSPTSKSTWFSPRAQQVKSDDPRVTEVEFEETQSSASRFASQTEDWANRERGSETDRWSDRPQYYQDDDYRERDYPDDRYSDNNYSDDNYPDDDYPDDDYPDDRYPDRDYNQYPRYADGRDDSYETSNYANVDDRYRQASPQDAYSDDRYAEAYDREDYQWSQARPEDYQQVNYQDVAADHDVNAQEARREDYKAYDSYQAEHYEVGYDGAEEELPQEQFIIDYGDEEALDAFEVTLTRSTSGQYRWKRPAVNTENKDRNAETDSTDDGLEDWNDWEDWENDGQENVASDSHESNNPNDSIEANTSRPIQEVQRNPVAARQVGSIYSYSYRKAESTADTPTAQQATENSVSEPESTNDSNF